MLKYDVGKGERENWLLAEDAFDARHQGKCESVLSQGNGYLGLRAAYEEDYVGRTPGLFVAGTFDRFSENETTELPNFADILPIEMTLDGQRFTMDAGVTREYLRALDLYTGEMTRSLVWQSPSGARFSLRYARFVSLDNKHIVGQKLTVAPLSGGARVTLRVGVNGTVTNGGTQHFTEGESRVFDKRILRYTARTSQSGVLCCLHSAVTLDRDAAIRPHIDRRAIALTADIALGAGESLTLEKLTAVTTSRDLDDQNDAAERGLALAESARAAGYDALLAKSAEAWSALWRAQDIRIDSACAKDQLALRFAIYHLNILSPKDDPRIGLAAKGLSGEGYKGHAFWDTEIFMLPYFILCQPAIARNLLEYRYLGMGGAMRKAREMGYEGAMYPWEAAWSDDGETTPLWGGADIVTGKRTKILTGLIEQHITADVAFAVWQYYVATGDDAFMEACGWEMLIQTARFWASRVTWDAQKRAFVILDVIGPDEYKEHVDNNAYTNYMAANNLRLGLDAIDAVKAGGGALLARLAETVDLDGAAEKIRAALDGLYLPEPNAEGIIPQFDGYTALERIDLTPYKDGARLGAIFRDFNLARLNGIQVSKQADMVELLLLMDDLFPPDIKRKNFFYYESRTLHDSSLSKAAHSVLAADMDDMEMAYRFFQAACDIDMGEDMSTSSDGIHAAAMGGLWQCAVYGFLGVRIVRGELRVTPHLPAAWKSASAEIVWRGNRLRVTADGDGARIEEMPFMN